MRENSKVKEEKTKRTVDSIESLRTRMDQLKKAQESFSSYSQEQVDKIFLKRRWLQTKLVFLWQKLQLRKRVWEF